MPDETNEYKATAAGPPDEIAIEREKSHRFLGCLMFLRDEYRRKKNVDFDIAEYIDRCISDTERSLPMRDLFRFDLNSNTERKYHKLCRIWASYKFLTNDTISILMGYLDEFREMDLDAAIRHTEAFFRKKELELTLTLDDFTRAFERLTNVDIKQQMAFNALIQTVNKEIERAKSEKDDVIKRAREELKC